MGIFVRNSVSAKIYGRTSCQPEDEINAVQVSFHDEENPALRRRRTLNGLDSVQDGIILKDGRRRTISKHIHFVELDRHGKTAGAQ